MVKNLWGGRFEKKLSAAAKEYSFSLHIDKRLFIQDLKTNLAHAKGLSKVGIISEKEYDKLSDFVEKTIKKHEKNEIIIEGEDEDIHSYTERIITEALGDLGKKIHTGKSRNDQIVTDLRMYLKDEINIIKELITDVLYIIWKTASLKINIIFPGFTHLQPAQPVLLSHYLLAYFEMFSRDRQRFMEIFERTDICPLGSGALAGNNFKIDRSLVARELNFSKISKNSMDAVADRDFVLEFASNASLCMLHLSRICEELIVWSSPMVGFIEIGDEFTTGSSIMPQKKNPDIAELIRGRSGSVMGGMTGLFYLIKGLPLTYNRDLQEDKVLLFEIIDTLKLSLQNFSLMLASITFKHEKIDKALQQGFLLATDLADYLVLKGVVFREAHEITGNVVKYAEKNRKELEDLSYEELKGFSEYIQTDVRQVFKLQEAIDRKNVYGGTATKRVEYQLKKIQEEFEWNKL